MGETSEILTTTVDIHRDPLGYKTWVKALKTALNRGDSDILTEIENAEGTESSDLPEKIGRAVNTALSVRCILETDKEPYDIFSGNVSAVCVNSKGEMVWSKNELSKEVTDSYGNDLRPVAYRKAIAAMALDIQFGTTMAGADDFEMIQSFGYKHHRGGILFENNGEKYYLGISAALPSLDYAKKVGILGPEKTKITDVNLQGAFDTEFGKLVAFYLNNPQKDLGSHPIIPRPNIVTETWANQ